MANPVCLCTSYKVVSSLISVRISFPPRFSNTASSVITTEATPLPVRGSVHSGSNFIYNLPSFPIAECCIRTTTFEPEETKSMAPPMPFITLPGIIQLAISPFSLTWKEPNIVISRWPPLIIPKESEDEK